MKKKHFPCPLRWTVLLLSLLWLGFYFTQRNDTALMERICEGAVRPWHVTAGRLCNAVPFSLTELLGWCAVAAGVWAVVWLCRNRKRWKGWLLTAVTIAAAAFALFCLLWGVYYYAPTFRQQSALESRPISVEELDTVTRWFASLCSEYADRVPRNEAGECALDTDAAFDYSPVLYRAVEKEFPCLVGPQLRAKPVKSSIVLSYVNCTGFFCPYTAEANINTHVLPTLIPSTIAHELAHQRGVAAEDEANFVAVLASLADGREDYVYSAAVMAYIYLGNALYEADRERWQSVYESLSPAVRTDLNRHNAYWNRFETPVKEVSDQIYTGFLRTYGDDRGLRSYGACVDLLVVYYGERAAAELAFGENCP